MSCGPKNTPAKCQHCCVIHLQVQLTLRFVELPMCIDILSGISGPEGHIVHHVGQVIVVNQQLVVWIRPEANLKRKVHVLFGVGCVFL